MGLNEKEMQRGLRKGFLKPNNHNVIFNQESSNPMADEKLKECPFCNGDAQLFEHSEEKSYVGCLSCGADGPFPSENDSQSPEEAISAWNRRPNAK